MVMMSLTPPSRWLAVALLAASIGAAAQNAPAARNAGSAAPTAIQSFKISGNTLVDSARLQAVLARYLGPRDNQELRTAALALQALYREAGYGAVLVSVLQPGPDGIAEVRVLEGKLGLISVIGTQQFSAESVRRALPSLQEDKTPRIAEINRQVELANHNPARKLAVTLEPGQKVGAVDARVIVTEGPVLRPQFALDNTGTQQTGRTRISAGLRHADVGGRGHQASVNWQTSVEEPSRVSILSLNYMAPLPESARRIDLYAVRSNVDGGSTPTAAGALQFNGRGNVLGAQLTQLLLRQGDWDQRLRAGIDQREYRNRCTIEGLPEGACGAPGESVTVQPLTVDYSIQGGRSVMFGGNVGLSHNLGLGGRYAKAANFEAVREGARYRYTALRLGGHLQQGGGKQASLTARMSLQWTRDALVPGEQFGLAGANAVRGYREREITGDRGLLASLEWSPAPWALASRPDAQLRGLLFADWGKVWNEAGGVCRQGQASCDLHAVGLGLRFSEGPWRLHADLARAGRAGTLTDSGDVRLHLSASYGLD